MKIPNQRMSYYILKMLSRFLKKDLLILSDHNYSIGLLSSEF